MKKMVLLLMLCSMCTACGTKGETNVNESQQVGETVEDTTVKDTKVISPLPTTIDMKELDNCTLAVSFKEGDAYVDDIGVMQLDVTVYTYDLYDMIDVTNLKEGDTIVIRGNKTLVDSIKTLKSGLILINGGIDNGGYDLWNDESGVYFEQGYNDSKTYYEMGKATLRVSTDFEFVDSSDLEKGK